MIGLLMATIGLFMNWYIQSSTFAESFAKMGGFLFRWHCVSTVLVFGLIILKLFNDAVDRRELWKKITWFSTTQTLFIPASYAFWTSVYKTPVFNGEAMPAFNMTLIWGGMILYSIALGFQIDWILALKMVKSRLN